MPTWFGSMCTLYTVQHTTVRWTRPTMSIPSILGEIAYFHSIKILFGYKYFEFRAWCVWRHLVMVGRGPACDFTRSLHKFNEYWNESVFHPYKRVLYSTYTRCSFSNKPQWHNAVACILIICSRMQLENLASIFCFIRTFLGDCSWSMGLKLFGKANFSYILHPQTVSLLADIRYRTTST